MESRRPAETPDADRLLESGSHECSELDLASAATVHTWILAKRQVVWPREGGR